MKIKPRRLSARTRLSLEAWEYWRRPRHARVLGLCWWVLKTFSQVVAAEARVMMSFGQASNQLISWRGVSPHKCESLKAYITQLHQLSRIG